MMQDVFGQTTSLTHANSMDDWNATLLGFLAHSAVTPRHLGLVLEAEPDFAMGHAVKGIFYLLLGRRELYQTAYDALEAAKSAVQRNRPSTRELRYVDALEAYARGRPSASIAVLEQILEANPEDTLAMKLSHAIRFVLGDAKGMRASVERVLPAHAPDHPGRGYLLGCHAFALEETGEYERAEVAGRQALWTAPDDAWGLHAVAHVHDMTGRAHQGLEWLTGREAAWAHCNNFRYHVWWHKALMHLDLGQIDTVLDLYDQEIRKDRTDDYRDISNATSLLMRLELDGVDIGDRWEELAELSASRTEDGCLIFADLHYLLALSGDSRDASIAQLLGRLHRDAAAQSCEIGARMAAPGLPTALGVRAFGDGQFGTAFQHLSEARSTMQLAGGSHAQRDVFERLTIDAGIRAGYLDQAEHILNERQAQRAGAEDGYAAARRDLIALGRGEADAQSVPAQ